MSRKNRFANDGSFLEQFKKNINKEETPETSQDGNESHAYSIAPQNQLKQESCKRSHPEDVPSCSDESAPHPDWFQDALRRAREKAQELIGKSSEVSLPVGAQESDESKNFQPARKKNRWEAASPSSQPVAPSTPTQAPSQQTNFTMPNAIMDMMEQGQHMEAIQGVMLTKLTRNNPAIIAYASHVFGNLDLADAQWKQCEEQMKMNIIFQILQAKKQEAARLEKQGKFKYEYDSDEDIDGGTWEHKRRKAEMESTLNTAQDLTTKAEGKHHIGDFLPPDELQTFIEKYTALKEGRDPDLSDYRENKLTEDNVGYRMLKSMGWTEGKGLGAQGTGITNPLNSKGQNENTGLGVGIPHSLSADDDEYDAYRKRMMLAYRFRPNPLNNPRRSYY